MDYVDTLREAFEQYADAEIAAGQKAYMKNKFEFFGIKSPIRKELQKPFFLKEYLPSKADATKIAKACWQEDQREFQMFAQEFLEKYKKQVEEKDIELLEYMITNKSWWDSVDFIASHLVGDYFKKYPHLKEKYVKKWCAGENMWLRRTAIIFQLKYKDKIDQQLLTYAIEQNLGSKEFFINKAIGWMLREYGKTNSNWVMEFVEAHPTLHSLSVREATRIILKESK